MEHASFGDDRIWPRRAAQSLVSSALLVATLAVFGRLIGLTSLASYGAGNIPMAPFTSICFIALAAAFLIALRPAAESLTRVCAGIVCVLVAACGLVVWLADFAAAPIDADASSVAAATNLQAISLFNMSPLAGALFVLAGVALTGLLVVHSQATNARAWLCLAAALGSLVAIGAVLVMVSYAIDSPLFYGSASLPMALPTAIAFVLLGGGLVAMAVTCGPDRGHWSWRLSDVPVATQLGVGLSGIVMVVLVFGYAVHLQKSFLWAQTKALYEHPFLVVRTAGELKFTASRIGSTLQQLARATDSREIAKLVQDFDSDDAAARRASSVLAETYLGAPADIVALKQDLQQWHVAREALLRPATSASDHAVARSQVAAEGAATTRRVLDRIDLISGSAARRAEQFSREAERRNGAIENSVVAVFVAVVLASTLVGWLLSRQISGPVRELTSVAAQFGQGKLDVRSQSGSGNEFGVLAATLNAMADTIQANVQSAGLLTEQLRRSEASLAAQNRELEAFSYSVSHDLRAPLRSIDGFSRILLEDYNAALDAEGSDFLKRIRAAAQHMAQLIDDMLRLSRVSRGELHYEPVDLSAMVREIAAGLLQQQDPQRQVTLDVADGLVANGDRQLLRVALTNLLDNAWKFTSKRVDACIEFGAREQDGRRVYFVRDNGVGFDPTYADKLFGAFQRLHAKSEFPGTGIGLATVQRVLHRLGGSVWAASAPDHGATFSFAFDIQADET